MVVENQGSIIEEINVTLYLNDDAFESLSTLVKGGESASCNLTWDTSVFSKGNYAISAAVDAVLGENDTADNTLVGNNVTATIPGDVDGDRDVDIFDIVVLADAYGSKEGDTKYVPDYNIDGSGTIDIVDIVIATGNYGRSG